MRKIVIAQKKKRSFQEIFFEKEAPCRNKEEIFQKEKMEVS